MRHYEFNLITMWESYNQRRLEFVYLLEWDSKQQMISQWDKFMKDQQWSKIKDESHLKYGLEFVEHIEEHVMQLVDSSKEVHNSV